MNNTIYLQRPGGEQFKVEILVGLGKDMDSLLDQFNDSGVTHVKESDYIEISDPMKIEFVSDEDSGKVIAVMTTQNIYENE